MSSDGETGNCFDRKAPAEGSPVVEVERTEEDKKLLRKE